MPGLFVSAIGMSCKRTSRVDCDIILYAVAMAAQIKIEMSYRANKVCPLCVCIYVCLCSMRQDVAITSVKEIYTNVTPKNKHTLSDLHNVFYGACINYATSKCSDSKGLRHLYYSGLPYSFLFLAEYPPLPQKLLD